MTIRFLLILGCALIVQNTFSQFSDNESKKLERAIKVMTTQYVDSLDDAKMVQAAIQGMLSELDPHSKYMNPDETRKNNESINGNFAGVGIQYQIIDDTLIVLKVNKEGPAEKAGILPGDRFVSIDNESCIGKVINNAYFSSRLRGQLGTKVNVTIMRANAVDSQYFEIQRGAIPIPTLDAAFMINKNVAYIKINGFSNTTITEFQLAVFSLQIQGMEDMILDLRGNPGGVMKAAIDLSAMFLEDKKLIVYTQGLHYPKEDYLSKSKGELTKGRLIILMDENSASASEIVAGAIQDWDRGMIVGRRSYGKGLVGRTFTLTDGSSIRLTTGRYYTPTGRSIQKPYTKGDNDTYNKDLRNRMEHGELYSADSISFPDSLKFRTAGGRLVYGGGAIMPDFFISMDTNYSGEYFRKLNNTGALNLFAGKLFKRNLDRYKTLYPNYSIFHAVFEINTDELVEFRKFADTDFQTTTTDTLFEKDKKLIMCYLKAILARNLFEGSNYFQEISTYDKSIQKSIELIGNRKLFKDMKIQDN